MAIREIGVIENVRMDGINLNVGRFNVYYFPITAHHVGENELEQGSVLLQIEP